MLVGIALQIYCRVLRAVFAHFELLGGVGGDRDLEAVEVEAVSWGLMPSSSDQPLVRRGCSRSTTRSTSAELVAE